MFEGRESWRGCGLLLASWSWNALYFAEAPSAYRDNDSHRGDAVQEVLIPTRPRPCVPATPFVGARGSRFRGGWGWGHDQSSVPIGRMVVVHFLGRVRQIVQWRRNTEVPQMSVLSRSVLVVSAVAFCIFAFGLRGGKCRSREWVLIPWRH